MSARVPILDDAAHALNPAALKDIAVWGTVVGGRVLSVPVTGPTGAPS